MSVPELAEQVGLTEADLEEMEAELRPIPDAILARLAELLDVEPEQIGSLPQA